MSNLDSVLVGGRKNHNDIEALTHAMILAYNEFKNDKFNNDDSIKLAIASVNNLTKFWAADKNFSKD